MIPKRTLEILGGSQPVIKFDPDTDYAIESYQLQELEALMRRFYLERAFDADEMRDWGNRLHAMLRRAEGF